MRHNLDLSATPDTSAGWNTAELVHVLVRSTDLLIFLIRMVASKRKMMISNRPSNSPPCPPAFPSPTGFNSKHVPRAKRQLQIV